LWDTRYSQDSREKNFRFLCTEDILYAAAFDANGGFEPVFGEGMLSFQIV
jgi:hypothetical protein